MKKNINNCRKAFTLVKVLITIGIIGVFVAITIPTLLQNTNNQKTVSTSATDVIAESKSNADSADSKNSGNSTNSSNSLDSSGQKTLILDGAEYKFIDGAWYHDGGDGNLIDAIGRVFYKTSDGYERPVRFSERLIYDNEMHVLGLYKDGTWYDNKGNNIYVREDADGNLLGAGNQIFTKTPDGYEYISGPIKYVYDNNLKELGMYYKNTWYDKKGHHIYVREKNGNLVSYNLTEIYYKISDGYEMTTISGCGYVYDNDMNPLRLYLKGERYDYNKVFKAYVRKDSDGNLVVQNCYSNGTTFTKTSDGLYTSGGHYFDENLIRIK